MKELEQKKESIEISVKQQKEIKHTLDGEIIPQTGHRVFEINEETLEVSLAKYEPQAFHWSHPDTPKRLLKVKGCVYIPALNAANALRKYRKNPNQEVYYKRKPTLDINDILIGKIY